MKVAITNDQSTNTQSENAKVVHIVIARVGFDDSVRGVFADLEAAVAFRDKERQRLADMKWERFDDFEVFIQPRNVH